MTLVYVSIGSYEDYEERHIFVTKDKAMAERYISKANDILEKWQSFYDEKSTEEANSDYETYIFTPRHYDICSINGFFTKEVEER